MATLELNIDFAEILREHADQATAIQKELQVGVQALAASTHAHVLEEASKKLRSRQQAYTKATSLDRIADNVWAVTLHKEALWIEEGQPAHSMIPDLLAGAEKRGKLRRAADGSSYMVVPFQHAKGPTQQTTEARGITQKLKAELKARKVPYQKIERNPDGSPKTGLLHKLNLGGEQRGATAHNAPWASPVLDGVRIYQHVTKGQGGKTGVRRDIMTFRVASSKHFGQKWNHPGQTGVHLIDEALTWASNHWEAEILPSILARFK